MKNRFLFAALAMGLLAWSCQKDGKGSGPNPEEGEKSTVSLTITTNQPAVSRGAGDATEDPTLEENTINTATGLKVYVFKEDGALDYKGALSLSQVTGEGIKDTYKSNTFEITAGKRYFYVFANDERALVTPENENGFMRLPLPTAYTSAVPSIATGNFLIGTLWKEETVVGTGGTVDKPVQIDLEIGRLASKVCLKEVIYENSESSSLKGKFENAEFRLGGLAKTIHNVGIHEGDVLPTRSNVLVKSFMHEKPYSENDYLINAEGAWKIVEVQIGDVPEGKQPKWKENYFYATENTTEPDADNKWQYFVNTTFIQIKTKYIPKNSEVYDIATGNLLEGDDDYIGGTFWTAMHKGVRKIFNGDPSGSTHFTDLSEVKTYTDGINYHKFAIFDPNETDNVKKYRVLRNHYYEFTVTQFNDLGAHEAVIDPKDPLPAKTTVVIKVKVLPWSKVTGSVTVG